MTGSRTCDIQVRSDVEKGRMREREREQNMQNHKNSRVCYTNYKESDSLQQYQ